MGTIIKKVKLFGDKGERELNALFDSGSNKTTIKESIAKEISTIIELPPVEIQEATKTTKKKTKNTVMLLQMNGCNIPIRVLVMKDLTEDFLIGTETMQNWKIKLNFEKDEVDIGECKIRL